MASAPSSVDDPYVFVHSEELTEIEKCLDIVELEDMAHGYEMLISNMAMKKMSKNL